jgi:hypothetical protein
VWSRPKTISAPHAAVRTAVPPMPKMRKKGKRRGSALDMELRFTVSEKHFLISYMALIEFSLLWKS